MSLHSFARLSSDLSGLPRRDDRSGVVIIREVWQSDIRCRQPEVLKMWRDKYTILQVRSTLLAFKQPD